MKNRNAFFNNQVAGYINPNGYGYQEGYYEGQFPNQNMNMDYNELETRINKIERQLARINERINKLESSTMYSNNDDSMYMI